MAYTSRIQNLVDGMDKGLIDFSMPRTFPPIPTQASSNFITNKEQGDWAEDLVFRAFNESSRNYKALRYGKSDDVVAGEEGFKAFFAEFQEEMDTIGKRPDLLIFRLEDYNAELGDDISHLPHAEIHEYVCKAVAGIEIRSSAFLIDRYDEFMARRRSDHIDAAMQAKAQIMDHYADLLDVPTRRHYLKMVNDLTPETLSVTDFRVPSWKASQRHRDLTALLKQVKAAAKELQKRDFLSITAKVEDLKVVHKWIQTFNVPHYYFQVFFDKIYGLSFERILEIISNPKLEGDLFEVEGDIKNQNKLTIKLNAKTGTLVAGRVDQPTHSSARKEMDRGRLLFYVTFEGGQAYLDIQRLTELLGIPTEDF